MGNKFEKLSIGDSLLFWQIKKNIKIQYPFGNPKTIIMLAAGTGITPMFQALSRLFDDNIKKNGATNKRTNVILLYGSRTKSDIYLHSEMEQMKQRYSDRLEIVYCLSNQQKADRAMTEKEVNMDKEEFTNSMVFHHGHIDKDVISHFCKGAIDSDNVAAGECLVWVCGPPSFYESHCGPREEEDVTGVLKELGFRKDQVVKF